MPDLFGFPSGGIEVTGSRMRCRQEHSRFQHRRVACDRLAKIDQGELVVAEKEVGAREQLVEERTPFAVHAQRGVQHRQRARCVAGENVDRAHVGPCLGVVRVQLDRPPEVPQRVVVPSTVRIDETERPPRLGRLAVDRTCRLGELVRTCQRLAHVGTPSIA